MNIRPHSGFPALVRRAGECPLIAWEGVLYRSATPRYATTDDLLTGLGSARHGGRWNPPGLAVVYASTTPETALAEALRHCHYYRLPISRALPRVFVAVDARLGKVLDLTDGNVRRLLAVTRKALLSDDWREALDEGRESLTQALGRVASEAGAEGILAPSAALSGGVNLICFPGNRVRGSRLTILHRRELPKHAPR